MIDIGIFFVRFFVALIDPLGLIGYVAIGLLVQRLPWALGAAAAWALAMEIIVTLIARTEGARYGGEGAIPRVLGALLVAWVVFLIARSIRRRREVESKKDNAGTE